jgi:cell division protein FtsW (lipid II flippase)
MKTLDAGSALGAAALVVSTAALLATHAPDINKVSESRAGTGVATDLRVAELSTAAMVLLAGGVGSFVAGAPWPILLALTAVGGSIAVYEAFLHFQRP